MGSKLVTIAIPILDDDNEVAYVAMSVRDELSGDINQNVFSLETEEIESLRKK